MSNTPYFYIIKHTPSGKQYAGCKYAADANPANFMTQRGYKTSSKHIKKLIKEDGLDSFEVIKILTEADCGKNVFDYESDFLVENKCAQSSDWLNRHNNNKGFKCGKKGRVPAINLITGEQKRISKEEFDSQADWVGTSSGKEVTAKTREKLSSANSGKVTAKHTITGIVCSISKEEFDSQADWVGHGSKKIKRLKQEIC